MCNLWVSILHYETLCTFYRGYSMIHRGFVLSSEKQYDMYLFSK